MRRSLPFPIVLALALPLLVAPAWAQDDDDDDTGQLEDNLSAYVGKNAEGYLGPLRDGIGGALNVGLFMYPGVPQEGFHIRLDARAMVVQYEDDDRTFRATTEESFGEAQTVDAPTVVGSTQSITVDDPGSGALFTFPGGFDIGDFGLAAPQITVGSLIGTELMGRWIAVSPDDFEVDRIELWGVGARHTLNHWFTGLPLALSIHGMYQNLKVDDDFIESDAFTLGATGGKTWGMFSAYGGVSYNSTSLDAMYESDASGQTETVNVSLESQNSVDFGLGGTFRLGFVHLNGELHAGERTAWTVGVGLGN